MSVGGVIVSEFFVAGKIFSAACNVRNFCSYFPYAMSHRQPAITRKMRAKKSLAFIVQTRIAGRRKRQNSAAIKPANSEFNGF